ncbi:MAG: hypothetical protein U0V70_02540 [Terriglobia bacterium]
MSNHTEVLVTGKDMFGVPFHEMAELIKLSKDELSFSLYRPVDENLPLRINVHPDQGQAEFWVEGLISKVKYRLDGKQTVELRVQWNRLAS